MPGMRGQQRIGKPAIQDGKLDGAASALASGPREQGWRSVRERRERSEVTRIVSKHLSKAPLGDPSWACRSHLWGRTGL